MQLIKQIDEEELFSEKEFVRDVDINLDALNAAIVSHSGRYWRYGKLHATAELLLERERLAVEVAEQRLKYEDAKLNDEYRQSLADEEGKKPTEKAIEAAVLKDAERQLRVEELNAQREKLLEIEHECALLSLAEKVFSKRTDLLLTLGYMTRAEMRTESMQVPMASRQEMAKAEIERLKRGAEEVRAVNRRRR